MDSEGNISIVDQYLELPYWIIDVFPKQVTIEHSKQYFKVEKYYLSHPHIDELCRRYAMMLIKLSCYTDMEVILPTGEKVDDSSPETIECLIFARKPFFVLLKSADAMIDVSGEDTYLTLYNAKAESLDLVRALAASEGLFIWQPNNKD